MGTMVRKVHRPHTMLMGESHQRSLHATVTMRNPGVDRKWQYFRIPRPDLLSGRREMTDDELFEKLMEWDKAGFRGLEVSKPCLGSLALHCGRHKCASKQNHQGIIAGHAYCIIEVKSIRVENKPYNTVKLLKIRNPHATNE